MQPVTDGDATALRLKNEVVYETCVLAIKTLMDKCGHAGGASRKGNADQRAVRRVLAVGLVLAQLEAEQRARRCQLPRT